MPLVELICANVPLHFSASSVGCRRGRCLRYFRPISDMWLTRHTGGRNRRLL